MARHHILPKGRARVHAHPRNVIVVDPWRCLDFFGRAHHFELLFAGVAWFQRVCAALNVPTSDTFRTWLSTLAPELTKGPFNHEERAVAGLVREWYDPEMWPEGLKTGLPPPMPKKRKAAAAAVAAAAAGCGLNGAGAATVEAAAAAVAVEVGSESDTAVTQSDSESGVAVAATAAADAIMDGSRTSVGMDMAGLNIAPDQDKLRGEVGSPCAHPSTADQTGPSSNAAPPSPSAAAAQHATHDVVQHEHAQLGCGASSSDNTCADSTTTGKSGSSSTSSSSINGSSSSTLSSGGSSHWPPCLPSAGVAVGADPDLLEDLRQRLELILSQEESMCAL